MVLGRFPVHPHVSVDILVRPINDFNLFSVSFHTDYLGNHHGVLSDFSVVVYLDFSEDSSNRGTPYFNNLSVNVSGTVVVHRTRRISGYGAVSNNVSRFPDFINDSFFDDSIIGTMNGQKRS